MTSERAIIETENLTKRYWRHDAVQGLNLCVEEGAALALIGANGAGKTTTLRMLVDILHPDSGSARVLGIDSRRLTAEDFYLIGYVSENQRLPDRLSVDDYFDYVRGFYPNWDRALEREFRSQMELPGSRALGKLSHGMRMKVMLSAALAFRPKLLILDEPLSGLDPLVRDEVMAGMLKQADETTVVISSHELAEIEGCVTHAAFMVKGRLLFQESIEKLSARFRDVQVILDKEAGTSSWPATWLKPQINGRTLRFIDSAFEGDSKLQRQLADLSSGGVTEVSAMSLREISKELMRATRVESEA